MKNKKPRPTKIPSRGMRRGTVSTVETIAENIIILAIVCCGIAVVFISLSS